MAGPGLTTEVTVVVLTSTAFTIFAFSGPVGHATELISFGERCIGNTVEGSLGWGWRTPFVLRGEGGDNVCDRNGSHIGDKTRIVSLG